MTKFARFWSRLGIVAGVPWILVVGTIAIRSHRDNQNYQLNRWETSIRQAVASDFRAAAQEWERLIALGVDPDEAHIRSADRFLPDLADAAGEGPEALIALRLEQGSPPESEPFPLLFTAAFAFLPVCVYAGLGWAVNALFIERAET